MELTAPCPEHPCRLVILGATGSIGKSTLDIVRQHPESFRIIGLTAQSNWQELANLAREFRPHRVAIAEPSHEDHLRTELSGLGIEILAGADASTEVASLPCDRVVSAIVGIAGLAPTYEAARLGRVIALANKESLVAAGSLMMDCARESGSRILPVDSEHNAIFQALGGTADTSQIDRIILTASGGPFRDKSLSEMHGVTVEEALNHPVWSMGQKISIDSATMMNKGLEIIEAAHLFGLDSSKIDVLIHHQSTIHSLVEYRDGSILAQLGRADMKIPISYCLGYPERVPLRAERLKLEECASLTFSSPDEERFPALRLAREALNAGRSAPVVLNGANEVAVAAFLNRRIGFTDIAAYCEMALSDIALSEVEGLDDVVAYDNLAREHVAQTLAQRQT